MNAFPIPPPPQKKNPSRTYVLGWGTNKQMKKKVSSLTHYIIWKKMPLERIDVGGSVTDDNNKIVSTYCVQRIVLWVGFNYVN